MQPRPFQVVPVLLFFALLLLPVAARITGVPRVPPLEEYRKLAERPHLRLFWTPPKIHFLDFAHQFDRWYSDRFATRPFWVRLHTQALYSLFRDSDQVHVGKQGWLYYRTVIDTEAPALEQITPETRKAMIDRLARLTELLQQRGITLYVMPLALKNRYYPEFLPASAAHAKRFKFFDRYMDEAAADGRVHLIDTRKTLEAAKRGGLKTWHQTDFHWTDPAGALAARQIIDLIGAREGKPELARSFSYDVTPMPDLSGGQARFLPLFKVPKENSIGVAPKAPVTEFAYKNNENGIEWQGTANPGQPPRFEPVLVYGDSYFDALSRSGFFSLFRAFGRARTYTNDMTVAYQNRPPGTRYMVIEFITSATGGTDNYITALIQTLEKDPSL